ncbi:Molybdenum-pterin-binding protein MopA [Rhodovastum atsumiense]|uniref:LysR family transcriptional regulator n=1 Tax=Rhodovastum atsumiense TaxID=504468 RepID=A0A5M6ITT3_9PROT|nr:TOBE domain-containing protein [Rhodovastum atsumiense]KAA5610845.1 LysR family transcriptional regulator [Rhodovastum atsumiense]CAH2602104.1 Molybdenum-pterin-binding protein MopA [Rhodovastum atsumiense]
MTASDSSSPPRAEAILYLRGEGQLPVGRERIAMLEAVAAHGSITAAAKALGYSYKAVWDGLNAVNNLLPRPALQAQSGGRGGGGAVLTEEGHRLIAAFHRLEERLSEISAGLAREGTGALEDPPLWSFAMKTSARNAFHCKVVGIQRAPVNAEVELQVTDSSRITAVITRHSVDELRLMPGRSVIAMVKSSFVLLARLEEATRLSVRNRLDGTVLERVDGGVNTEIEVDIGGGKTLTAVITRHSADALGLRAGEPVSALFDAGHVILVVD